MCNPECAGAGEGCATLSAASVREAAHYLPIPGNKFSIAGLVFSQDTTANKVLFYLNLKWKPVPVREALYSVSE